MRFTYYYLAFLYYLEWLMYLIVLINSTISYFKERRNVFFFYYFYFLYKSCIKCIDKLYNICYNSNVIKKRRCVRMQRKLLFTIRMDKPKELNGNLKVPKYLQERFGRLEPDESIDPEWGKYMLYFADGWGYPMGADEIWNSIPVMNKKEAINFLKEAERCKK